MSIAVVTDSGADLPPEVAKELKIEVVPLYVIFGRETFRDGVQINPDEFYERLKRDPCHPTTSHPSPGDFLQVYERLSQKARGIISIHLSEKLSKSWQTARYVRDVLWKKKKCQIEVIDSQGVGMWQGFLAMMAARLARQGKNLEEIAREVREDISHLHLRAVLDTLEYARRGGRLGKASVLLGPLDKAMRIMKVKPVLSLKDGEASPGGLVRSGKKISRLVDFIRSFSRVAEIAIEYSVDEEEVKKLIDKIKSVCGNIPLYVSKIGPVLGAHAGPGVLAVVVREE